MKRWSHTARHLLLAAGLIVSACSSPAPVIAGMTVTPATVAPGQLVTVSVNAAIADSTLLLYSWDVPEGWTTVGTGSVHAAIVLKAPDTFGAADIIGVTVRAASGKASSSQTAVTTFSGQAPVISSVRVTPNPLNPGETATLIASAVSLNGTDLDYHWESPDPDWLITESGDTAILTAPNEAARTTVVKLTVTDSLGLTSTSQTAVSTGPFKAPTVSPITITPNPVTPGGSSLLYVNATTATEGPLTYEWTVDDEDWTIEGEESLAHITAPTHFGLVTTVSVKVTDSEGQFTYARTSVTTGTIRPPTNSSVTIAVTPNPVSPGGTATMVTNATSPAGQPLTYEWTSSDPAWTIESNGYMATLTAPDETASTAVVTLVIRDEEGSEILSRVAVTTGPDRPPTVGTLTITPAPVSPGGTATALSNASSATGRALTYVWSISDPAWSVAGNGSSATITAPMAFNSTAVVTLTVTDTKGFAASTQALVQTGPVRPPVLAGALITPNPLTPGGTGIILQNATNPLGNPMTYRWSVSDPAWSITDGAPAVTITAPNVAQARTIVTVTVADSVVGSSTTNSFFVTTAQDRAPRVIAISTIPANATTRNPVQLRAVLTPPDITVIAWNWTLVTAPLGSATTLTGADTATPQFMPDTVGSYVVSLSITDDNGITSDPLTATVPVTNVTPRAVIAGTFPLQGAISSAVPLDARGSAAPAGNPLTYRWTVSATPAGASASFFADSALTIAGASVPQTNFVGTLPGNYTVLLTVTDVVTTLSSSAAAVIVLVAPGQLKLKSGGDQSEEVGTILPQPVVFQLFTADGRTPVAGQTIRAIASNGSLGSSSLITDTNGEVSMIVQGGRVAGTGTVQALVPGAPSVAPVSATFNVEAGPATSLALSSNVGSTANGATVTIQSVDRYGNPAFDNLAARTANVHIAASSTSGQAQLSTNDVTLTDGTATVTLTDPVAESVTLTLSASNVPLPLSAWQTTVDDAGAIAFGAWTTSVVGANSNWALQLDPALLDVGDTSAYGANINEVQALQTGASQLAINLGTATPTIETLSISYAAKLEGVIDPRTGCIAQPSARVTMRSSSAATSTQYKDTFGNPSTPIGGYAVPYTCGADAVFNGLPSFATSGWTTATFDVTDAVSQGFTWMALNLSTTTGRYNPADLSRWTVSQVRVRTLGPASNAPVSTTVVIRP